jgi:phage repressor protein C with HTH and peptisase S24 domain
MDQPMDAQDAGLQPPSPHPNIEPGPTRLPVRRVLFRLSAGVSGYEIEYEDGESEPIFMARRWFDQHGYRPGRLLAIKVTGRSMEPSLYDGDLVIVNLDDTRLQDGQVFAANYEGELVIKRLKRDAQQWFLSSDSPDKIRFSDKRCSDGCGLIGRVVYKQSEHI